MSAMLSQSLFASFADTAEQRYADRRVLRLQAHIASPAGPGGIQVHNLSKTGMLVEADSTATVGETIEVELPGGATRRAEVVWADDKLFGCRFAEPLTQAMLSAALLRSEPQAAEPVLGNISHQDAMARLGQHWAHEHASRPLKAEKKLPLGARMWIIGGLAVGSWAVPAAAAYLLF